jgi:hypothetical protein
MSTLIEKSCQNCKKPFNIDADDLSFYERITVPTPTFCPLCRAQRRLVFRNERGLYKRTCDFSGKEIFSMYAPDSPVKVYARDIWLSDVWDPMEYSKDIDWSRPFLAQLYELMLAVPFKANNVINGINSDYSNNATDPKNCYLVFNATNPEDCMYSNGVNFSRECVDVSHISKTESSYESFWLGSCYRTHYSSQCVDSSDLWFCRDCQGCMNCFGSVNLRNKNYCFFNEQYTREEYEKKVAEYALHTREGIERARSDSHAFWMLFPYKNHQGIKNIDCTGSYVSNSKNARDSFLVRECENVRYCQYLQETPGSKDCYDYANWGDGAELVYEAISCGTGIQNVKFAFLTQESVHDTEYTIACSNGSQQLFGCVGLRKKQYCILNKQYTKEEYEELVKKIKKHMIDMPYSDINGHVYGYGEFLPPSMSPWAYNETLAQEYFPLTKEEALARGYRWKDVETKDYVPTIVSSNVPSDIGQTQDSISSEIIECAHKGNCNDGCTKAFRIIPDELQFYRKIGVPVPILCPACRTMERLTVRLGLDLYDGTCACEGFASTGGVYINKSTHTHGDAMCTNVFKTGFNQDGKEIVYCEECYQQEIG